VRTSHFFRRLFEPLPYTVEATGHELDESMPALGQTRLFNVTPHATSRLSNLLTHLYILIPVLDDHGLANTHRVPRF
jgi:hypothetical protein